MDGYHIDESRSPHATAGAVLSKLLVRIRADGQSLSTRLGEGSFLTRYLARWARIGRDLTLRENVVLEVDDTGRLAAVEPTTGVEDAQRLEGVVCPGLIDCHVHLVLSAGSDVVAEVGSVSAEVARERALLNARAHLRYGVTAVRDLGSPGDVVVALAETQSTDALPRIVPAGAITSIGGHGYFLARQVDGPEEIGRHVRAIAAAGAPWLKLFATGGVLTKGSVPGARQFHDDELRIAVRTAHSLGLRVAAHAHGKEGIGAAVDAGVDSVEHASYADAQTARHLAAVGTVAVSTLVATERLVADRAGSPAETTAKIQEHAPRERRALTELIRAKAPLAAGTDAGTIHNPHGGGLVEQARLLSQAGAGPLEVLKTLTVCGADLLQLPAGHLSAGRLADWVIFEHDPVENLEALDRVLDVFVNGERVVTS